MKSTRIVRRHLQRDRILLHTIDHAPQISTLLSNCIASNEANLRAQADHDRDAMTIFESVPNSNPDPLQDAIDPPLEDIPFDMASRATTPVSPISEPDTVEPDLDLDPDSDNDDDPEFLLDFPQLESDDLGDIPTLMAGSIDTVNLESQSDSPFAYPEQLESLRLSLLEDYTLPQHPPADAPRSQTLSASELQTLKHFTAWHWSHGTVRAYNLHAQNLRDATDLDILSLHLARKLAVEVTQLSPTKVDICPRSCIAYTGDFKDLISCPFVRDRESQPCGQARYKAIAPTSPQMLRHRDHCLQEVLKLMATASGQETRTYSDFGDSEVHVFQYTDRKLFQDPRDVAIALYSDGAQLTMKKMSDTWLLIVVLLNLPPEVRYQSGNTIHTFSTPGPLPPGNMESFCYPLFQELAKASAGIWTWDAVESSYFVLHMWAVMALGDMLGSAKLSGMAGHAALFGDHFTMVKGARSSRRKGAKYQYYPLNPPANALYNPDRISYDFFSLPYRDEQTYWQTIQDLKLLPNKTDRAKIVTRTGVSRLPLCAASNAFIHPSFFPLDPFHLFYENCMPHLWDIWNSPSSQGEIIFLDRPLAAQLGSMVEKAMSTLPPSFCGPIRDPHQKRNSQYKIYEWMALLHWYIIPIGLELEINGWVLGNFAKFAQAVKIAMTIKKKTKGEVEDLFKLIVAFLEEFEQIYIGEDPEKISRCRLCIFQLIHVPQHILWNGSVRIGSQATVERAIGEVGHRIRSKKAPFAHLANIIHERELVKLLALRIPSLVSGHSARSAPTDPPPTIRPFSKVIIRRKHLKEDSHLQFHLQLLATFLDADLELKDIERWGKVSICGRTNLSSRLIELRGEGVARSSRYFEIHETQSHPLFGEALAFYSVSASRVNELDFDVFVAYRPIVRLHQVLFRWQGWWADSTVIARASSIHGVVGIWEGPYTKTVHIIRKHPALDMLTDPERGKQPENGDGDMDLHSEHYDEQ
ncbi:hypothetical protein HWV62_31195 [Athelia sp. TMB]|nr:hypothetical protein HWV62_31195 [Athelia sp. TMB]